MNKTVLIFSVLLFVILGACSPSQRISRIADRYNLKQWEDVIYRDTVLIKPDTFCYEISIDTAGMFYEYKDGNELIGCIRDSIVTIKVITKADTIYIEKKIPVETIHVKEVKNNKPLFGIISFLVGTAIAVILIFSRRLLFK
jgi:hypothetical protein